MKNYRAYLMLLSKENRTHLIRSWLTKARGFSLSHTQLSICFCVILYIRALQIYSISFGMQSVTNKSELLKQDTLYDV